MGSEKGVRGRLCTPFRRRTPHNEKLPIMQSVFSVAARRRDAFDLSGCDGRAGALKTDWAKLLHEACPMGIEWLAYSGAKGRCPLKVVV
jgi:hypothetical protein